jgi:2'-5' RNA ligase
MDYLEVSIRIILPAEISAVIMREKMRFVSEYGSKYKSEPHITLYLGRYTEEGFPKLIEDLNKLKLEQTTFTLLGLKMTQGQQGNSYVVDVSNYDQLLELRAKVSEVAYRYQSPLLREKDQQRLDKGIALESTQFVPHITLGSIPVDSPQPIVEEVQNNIESIVGKQIDVLDMTAFLYGKEEGEEKLRLIEEVKVSF